MSQEQKGTNLITAITIILSILVVVCVCVVLFNIGITIKNEGITIKDKEYLETERINDKEYSISELVGVYHAERDSNGTTYEYTLVISSNATGKLDEESYTFESKRAGITQEKSYGTGDISLTKKDITLLGYNGYIKNGNIILTINDKEIVFEK